MKFYIILAILIFAVQAKKGSTGGKSSGVEKSKNEKEEGVKKDCNGLRMMADEWSAKALKDDPSIYY